MNRSSLVCLILLAAGTTLVFAPVRNNGFINYDDGAYVTENPYIRTGVSWDNVAWAFSLESCEATGNWHPLTWLSLMADVTVFGVDASPMHLVNLGIHVLNVLLVFLMLNRLTGSPWASAIVAAIFGIHPLHVESVAWISERKDVQSTFFALLAIEFHLRSVTSGRIAWKITALVCYLLSLLSKQMYVTLPFLLLLLDYWPLQRLRLTAESTEQPPKPALKMLLWEKAPYLLIGLLFSVVAFVGQNRGGAIGTLEQYTILQRCLNAVVSYASYLWQTIWPTRLAVFYPYPDHLPWVLAGLSALLLITLSFFAWKWRERWPCLVVGWCWYLGTLLPVIGLVQIGRQRMADRYMYFPMIGLLVATTWFLRNLTASRPQVQKALGLLAVVVLVWLGWLSRTQIGYWRDSITLFTHTARVAPSSLAYTKIGYEKAQAGDFDAAANSLYHALHLNPNYVAAHTSLGNTFLAQGRPELAIRHFEAALELEPEHAEANYNLGILYSQLGRLEQAVEYYQAALNVEPKDARIHANLGVAYMIMKDDTQARKHLEAAIVLEPNLVEAHHSLGHLLMGLHRESEAIAEFQKVIELRPNLPEVHRKLAELYQDQGNPNRAAFHRNLAESSPQEENPPVDPASSQR